MTVDDSVFAGPLMGGRRDPADDPGGGIAADADRLDLNCLFEPRTIALIGHREDNRYCRIVRDNVLRLIPDPSRVAVVDSETTADPARMRLPSDTDVAYLMSGARTVPPLLRELSRRGVPGAVVLAAGFGESRDGAYSKMALLESAGGMRICGTSTLGLVNIPSGVGMFGAPLRPLRTGDTSLIIQSGGLANLLLTIASQRQIGLDKAVVTGTEVAVTLADYLDYFVTSGSTRVVGMHCESVSDGARFRAALSRARSAGVQVVLLLSGQSELASATVESHSGNLAAGRIWRDVAEGYGAIVVDSVDELTESLVLAANGRRVTGSGVQLVTVSGGDCSLMTDIATRVGVTLPRPDESTRARLEELLPGRAVVGNPMDVGGLIRPKPEIFRNVIEILCSQHIFDVLALRLNIPASFDEEVAAGYRIAFAVARAARKVPLVLTRASERVPEAWMRWFADEGVPINQEITKTLRAVHLAQTAVAREPLVVWSRLPRVELPDGAVLGLSDVADGLHLCGVDVVRQAVVPSATAAVEFGRQVQGAIVLKIQAPDLPHKSDAGGVLVGLADERSVTQAYERLASVIAHLGLVRAQIYAQEQVEDAVAEMLVGAVNDPSAGPVVTLGIGGIFTELIADTVSRPAPVDEAGAREMVDALRGRALLTGVRGRPPADIEALLGAIRGVSLFAASTYGRLSQLDINPILVRRAGCGAVAVDALAIRDSSWDGETAKAALPRDERTPSSAVQKREER